LPSGAHSSRYAARHLSFITEFTTDVRHVNGAHNVVADVLSRSVNAVYSVGPAIDYTRLAAAQQAEPGAYPKSFIVVEVPLPFAQVSILCDRSTGVHWPVAPAPLRRPDLDALHSLSHPGVRATQKLIASRFVLPGVNVDVRAWARCARLVSIRRCRDTPFQPLDLFLCLRAGSSTFTSISSFFPTPVVLLIS